MVSCCCGGQGDGEGQRLPAHHNKRIPYAVKNLSLMLLMMGKILPETSLADLIDQ